MSLTLAALSALVFIGAGCEGTGAGRLDLARFLGLPRPRRREFCAALSDTAPVDSRADVRDVAPFVERRTGPGDRSTTHVLWPFFSTSRTPEARAWALRPIVSVESRPGAKHVEALWPLATYIREGENKTLKIRPFVSYKRRARGGGKGIAPERDSDWFVIPALPTGIVGAAAALGASFGGWTLFPIFAGGRDSREGAYFAAFPLAGTVKGVFGKKKMSFFMWPLWLKTVDKRYESVNIMWPLMTYWKGKDQSGRRLWPLFGGNHREGRFDRRWYLWPFISTWKVGQDTKVPGDAVFVFPFYGRTRSYIRGAPADTPVDGVDAKEPHLTKPYLTKKTYLFPLFHRVHQARAFEEQKLRNLDEVQAPWPFLGYAKGEGLVTRKLWPVWGARKSNDYRKQFFLWRTYSRSVKHDEDAEYRWLNLAFLFVDQVDRWVEKDGRRYPPPWPEDTVMLPDPRIALGKHTPWRTESGEIVSRRWTQLWPLWHYRRDEKGNVQFQTLSLLPRKAAGRGEALWRPFYTLYRLERDASGGSRQSALLGLCRGAKRPETPERPGMRYLNLAGIVSYHRRSNVGKRWSVLGGLVGYERVGRKGAEDVRKAYRFLWVPLGRIPREVREKYQE